MSIQHKFVGNSLNLGYRYQRYWDNSMASAFFCGELGAGLFFISALYNSTLGMIIGLILTGVGKPYFHLAHMGVPARSWRAMLRPDRSWISRGLISIAIFTGFGFLHLLNVAIDLPAVLGFSESGANAVKTLIETAAIVFAFVVMVYQGFAMAHSKSIAIWDTMLMPASGMLYALTGGVVLTLLLGGVAEPEAIASLTKAGIALAIATFVVVLAVVYSAKGRSAGGEVSFELLTKTDYKMPFQALVLGVGFALPVLALLFVPNTFGFLIASAGLLVGFFTYRAVVFKVGVYEPVDIIESLGVI